MKKSTHKMYEEQILEQLMTAHKNMADVERVDAVGLIRLTRYLRKLLQQSEDMLIDISSESDQ